MTRHLIPLAALLLPACTINIGGKDDTGTTETRTSETESDPTDTTPTDGTELADYLIVQVNGSIIIGTVSEPNCTGTMKFVEVNSITTYYQVTGGDCTTTGDDYYMEVHVLPDGAYHFDSGVYAYEIDARYGGTWAGMFYSEAFAAGE